MNLLKNSKIEYIKQKAQELRLYDIIDYINSTFSISSEYINIAVIGRFKSGKSSLINSIVGREILPYGVVPLTTVVVSLSHGKELVKVFFENGKTEIIDISDLDNYVSEEKNPSNFKSVLRIEVYVDFPQELRLFKFIDTPGLDYSQIHNKITEKLYNSFECVIFCVSYDMPISESELRTIELLKKFAPEIIIALTKVDLIDFSELNKLVSFLNSRVKDIEIYPFSKKSNYLIEKFKNDVLLRYSKNYLQSKEIMIQKRNEIIEKSFLIYLNSILKTLDENFKRKKDFSIFFEEEKSRLIEFKKNIYEILKRINNENTTKIMNKFISYHDYLYKKACKILKDEVLDKSKKLSQVSNSYEKVIRRFIEDSLYYIFETEKEFILNIVSSSILNITKISNDFLNTTISRMQESIGVDIPILAFEEKNLNITWSKKIFLKVFDMNIDFLLPFFPVWLIKKFLWRKLSSDLSFDIEKSLIRAAMDVSESINNEIELFVKDAINNIENRFKTIENIIYHKDLQKESIQEIISFLCSGKWSI